MTTKDDDVFGLLKVPDKIIIRELRIELGQKNSYIDELKHELKRMKSDRYLEIEEFKKSFESSEIEKLKTKIAKISEKNIQLKEENYFLSNHLKIKYQK